MSLPKGPEASFPEESFFKLEVPKEAKIWKAGGWVLDGGSSNDLAVLDWQT